VVATACAYDAPMRRATLTQTRDLCQRRARREPAVAIAGDVASLLRAARQGEKRHSRAAEALERALPPSLLQHAWIESATTAQVVLGVTSSAAAYQVDRALREGGLAAVRTAMAAPQLRIRTRVGQPPE
jgi:pyruvate/2-oxoacid:ferredoxin oxidoreductase alpha subunit